MTYCFSNNDFFGKVVFEAFIKLSLKCLYVSSMDLPILIFSNLLPSFSLNLFMLSALSFVGFFIPVLSLVVLKVFFVFFFIGVQYYFRYD